MYLVRQRKFLDISLADSTAVIVLGKTEGVPRISPAASTAVIVLCKTEGVPRLFSSSQLLKPLVGRGCDNCSGELISQPIEPGPILILRTPSPPQPDLQYRASLSRYNTPYQYRSVQGIEVVSDRVHFCHATENISSYGCYLCGPRAGSEPR